MIPLARWAGQAPVLRREFGLALLAGGGRGGGDDEHLGLSGARLSSGEWRGRGEPLLNLNTWHS